MPPSELVLGELIRCESSSTLNTRYKKGGFDENAFKVGIAKLTDPKASTLQWIGQVFV